MFFNYFKVALRYLARNKTFTFINLFGLALGFFCFMLLSLYVHHELSYDSFHRDADRIFRVVQHEQTDNGETRHVSAVAAQVAGAVKQNFPDVEDVSRVYVTGRVTVGNEPLLRSYERTFTADPNFFTFFDYQLVEGNPATALEKPYSLVLTETTAKRYFGNSSPLGKSIWVSDHTFEITGVMKDPPKNSHLDFSMVFSHATWLAWFDWMKEWEANDWTSNSCGTYVKLTPSADIGLFGNKLTSLVKNAYPQDKKFSSSFDLQALTKIHTESAQFVGNERILKPGIKPFYIYMFIAVGFLILLIACLNYMNLSTAAALKRTREIGTRKSLGAFRSQLIVQFTTEAIVLSVISMFIAVAFLQLTLPVINNIVDSELQITAFNSTWVLTILAIMIGAGILSSLYPTFIVSRVSPTAAMKREIRLGNQSLPVRKLLIVTQFTISIVMITSTLVIYRQLNFMRSKDIGVSVENIVVVDINSVILRNKAEAVKAEFARLSEVGNVSVSSRVPGEWKDFPIVSAHYGDIESENIFVGIDKNFLETYKIELLEGRNFGDALADSSKVIISRLAVQQLGLQNPIGAVIEIPRVRFGAEIEKMEVPFRAEVVGVVEDFHFESLRSKMMPLVFGFWKNPVQNIDYYSLKITADDWEGTLKKLKEVNNIFDTQNPIEYTFLDQRFETFYEADALRGKVFIVFSLIIVFIATMGLFALVSYSVESRTKEIGIRKVLGASVATIIAMVSREFMLLIAIAMTIAIPLTIVFMQQWLHDFAYHISIGVGVFLVAGFATALVAGITIGVRSFRAATANPVKALRSE